MDTADYSAGELDMMQLSDSVFPTGLFATSNGLERLFLRRDVTTAAGLAKFNRAYLECQLGPSDCVILANAVDFCASKRYEKIAEADSVCCAIKTVKEARDASTRSGLQLARCVREFQKNDHILDWYHDGIRDGRIAGAYPVSFAVCCCALNIPKERSVLMLLYGFVSSTVGAALRLGMIQHFEGQKIIHELKPLISKTARESCAKPLDHIWQFAPYLEINQMLHEEMDSKMFIT